MIKILPNDTLATLRSTQHRWKTQGQLGEGRKEENFILGPVSLRGIWESRRFNAVLHTEEELFVENVAITFRFKSSKSPQDTVIWTEGRDDLYAPEKSMCIPSLETKKKPRDGAWALWFAESVGEEGVFFSQEPPFNYSLHFQCRPLSRTLTFRWMVNQKISAKESLSLGEVNIRRGDKNKLVEHWRRSCMVSFSRKLPSNLKKGWLAHNVASPSAMQELLAHIRSLKIGVDWCAIGPNYAKHTGDWLLPKDEFRDRMGKISRSISESNMLPAIQIAPFLAERNSKVAIEHRDWLVVSKKGNPVTVPHYGEKKNTMFVLDTTHVDVQNYIRHFLTIAKEQWGFRVFIIDRIGDVATVGQRSKEHFTQGEIMHSATGLIRETLGNKVLLVGINAPLLSSPKIWDIKTMTPGLSPTTKLSEVSGLASGIMHRAPWNGCNWLNTTGPLDMESFTSNDTAIQTLQSAILLSSGALIFSGSCKDRSQSMIKKIQNDIALFDACSSGRLSLGADIDRDGSMPLMVRNSSGWIGIFNLSRHKKKIQINRDMLRSVLGVTKAISAGEDTILNSPEIHVILPPWGHRLFQG